MKRLTYKNQDGICVEKVNITKRQLIDKVEYYEELEEKLQGLYPSNEVGIERLVSEFIKANEDADKEPFKGYRILTNKDALLYDEWRKTLDKETRKKEHE